jgi:glutamate synthase domain-containing protein 2
MIVCGFCAIALGRTLWTVLLSAACQQYRVCGTGKCPVGLASQDPAIRASFDVDAATARVANFLNVTLEELRTYARITGHPSLRDLSLDDLVTIISEISSHTAISHA